MGKTNTEKALRVIFGIVFLGMFVGFLYFKTRSDPESNSYESVPIISHSNGQLYRGSESCVECHAEIYEQHIQTAHYKTSSSADLNSVKGSFEHGNNTYVLNDSIFFKMTSDEGNLYQETWHNDDDKPVFKSKIDLVVGSGTKGQSYLTWANDSLHQLQVSYFTKTNSWTNSPGMAKTLNIKPRPVNAKCMECHSTFAKNTALYGMGNTYEKSKIIYGVDCERCHGPSAMHVDFHRNNPEYLKGPMYMVTYDTLTTQRRMDVCALCHSGVRQDKRPSFEFLVGDRLTDFSLPDPNSDSLQKIDVHGNQHALLRASKCFSRTETMDCNTCHDPHKNQRGDMRFFNQKCMQCHGDKHKGANSLNSIAATENHDCVRCHMPLQPSKTMFLEQVGDTLKFPVEVRTHRIAIYADQIKKDTGE